MPSEMGALVNARLLKASYIDASKERMRDSNRDQLITAAELLRPLLNELVFVGGSIVGLLITDEAAADPRITIDVDAIAEITSYPESLLSKINSGRS
jgi:hypothetical protein